MPRNVCSITRNAAGSFAGQRHSHAACRPYASTPSVASPRLTALNLLLPKSAFMLSTRTQYRYENHHAAGDPAMSAMPGRHACCDGESQQWLAIRARCRGCDDAALTRCRGCRHILSFVIFVVTPQSHAVTFDFPQHLAMLRRWPFGIHILTTYIHFAHQYVSQQCP